MNGSHGELVFMNGSNCEFSVMNWSYANFIYGRSLTSATAAKCSASAATTSGVFSGAMGATPSKTGATGRVYS